MSLEERNNKKLTPDLVVGLDSGLEDLVGLLEKGKTELYSLQSITSFFVKNGYPEAVTILLKGLEDSMDRCDYCSKLLRAPLKTKFLKI